MRPPGWEKPSCGRSANQEEVVGDRGRIGGGTGGRIGEE